MKYLLFSYTLTLTMQISHALELLKLDLKNYLRKKNKLRLLYLIKTDLRMPLHYLRR